MALQTTAAVRELLGCSSTACEHTNKHPQMTGRRGAAGEDTGTDTSGVMALLGADARGFRHRWRKPLSRVHAGAQARAQQHACGCTRSLCARPSWRHAHRVRAYTMSRVTLCPCSHRDHAHTTPNYSRPHTPSPLLSPLGSWLPSKAKRKEPLHWQQTLLGLDILHPSPPMYPISTHAPLSMGDTTLAT